MSISSVSSGILMFVLEIGRRLVIAGLLVIVVSFCYLMVGVEILA